MEKVIIISGSDYISNYKADEINEYLDKGWTVKNVNMVATKDYTTAVFVLEKK